MVRKDRLPRAQLVYRRSMAMEAFVDPRGDPNTQMTEAVARTTNEPSALSELHCLCRDNRLYDVERWIQAGRRFS